MALIATARPHTMPPKRSHIWDLLEEVGPKVAAGNQRAKCKGCGKEATHSPKQWVPHFDECDGSLDPDITAVGKAKAEKVRKDNAEKERQAASVSRAKQQTKIPALNQQQLQDLADEAIARWCFATGQPLRGAQRLTSMC